MTRMASTSAAIVACHPRAPLSDAEHAQLIPLEGVIRRGQRAFVALSMAFLEIRTKKLYQAEFPTFESYCRERWGISRVHGARLAMAGRIVADCQAKGLPPPRNERTARLMREAERRPRKPRAPEDPREPLEGKLVVALVWQVQRVRECPNTGRFIRQRVSDHATEQDAEAEIRKLQAGSQNGQANGHC